MGGHGSGNWYRWNTKTTTDNVKQIDIRTLKRKGWFKQEHSGSLKWTTNGETSGNINYTRHHNSLILNYKLRSYGEDWQPVKQVIHIDTTACNYGGNRPWFLCPNCGYRCAILYGADVLFLCRKCYNLPYSSQMQGELNRLIDQMHKLGYRIFEDYDGHGWRKKKGMHQKTFDRLYLKYRWLDMKIDEEIFARCGQYF